MSELTRLYDRPYAMEYSPGLPRHCLINGFFFCSSQRVAEMGDGEDYGDILSQHLRTEHGVKAPLFPGPGSWSRNAFIIGTRNGKPVLNTQLHKRAGWTDHYAPGTGTFLGRSFKCPCGFKSDRAQPGETYPPIDHTCTYHENQGWRIHGHELDDHPIGMPTVSHHDSNTVTRSAIICQSKDMSAVEVTDEHVELRMPNASCWRSVEVGGLVKDYRVFKGLTFKAPRELRVPLSFDQPDLFRPGFNDEFSISVWDLVNATLPSRCASILFSAAEADVIVSCP